MGQVWSFPCPDPCPGWWVLGLGSWVGLLGWVRGTGPALAGNVGIGGAFALRARGGKVSTFLCSLRLSPAAALVAATANAISATATIAAPTTAPTALLEGFGRKGINRGDQEGQAPRLAERAWGGKGGGWRVPVLSFPMGYDHLRRCVGAGFEASGSGFCGFDVVNGCAGMLFGRGGHGSGGVAGIRYGFHGWVRGAGIGGAGGRCLPAVLL